MRRSRRRAPSSGRDGRDGTWRGRHAGVAVVAGSAEGGGPFSTARRRANTRFAVARSHIVGEARGKTGLHVEYLVRTSYYGDRC